MINQQKWINSLLKTNIKFNEEEDQVDHSRWVNTIPQKNTYNRATTYNSAAWKYSLVTVLFVCGLLFVSVIKNDTRNLEKDIDSLRASNKVIKFNLDQAILDNEVITSPENISRLAKEYLDTDFTVYKRSQIRQLNEDTKTIFKIDEKDNNLSTKIKSEITQKIEEKKTEIRKLKALYSKPGELPGAIKTQVAMKIEKKKIELKNIYNEPKDIFTLERVGRWSIVQVVKLFLGMPVIPGK